MMMKLFLWYGWPTKGVQPYFQSDHSANHRHAASTVWSCAGPEFRLSWMKLCRNDNHYITTLNYPTPLYYTTSRHYTTLRHYTTALIWPKFGSSALSVTRYHGQLSPCTISETNDLILRKLTDRRTDRQMDDRWTESDFIGCCQTNVERTKSK